MNTHPTLEQIARETAQQIAHLYLAKNGCPFPDMSNEEFVAFSVLDYSPLILTALQTATKQDTGKLSAIAAACNFDISGDTSIETTVRRLYHENLDLKAKLSSLAR